MPESGPSQKGRFSLNSSQGAALIITAAVVAYFGLGTLLHKEEEASTEVLDTRPDFTVLTRAISPEERVLTLPMSGRTEAGRRVVVRNETPAAVAAIPVEEGQKVEQGAVLCRLNVDSRQAVHDEAAAALTKARSDFEAAERLHEEGFSSDAALKSARTALDGAQARYAQATQDLQNTDVKAPFAGVVAETLVEPGDFLPAGSGCAILADFSQIVIVGGVPAQTATLLSEGDAADVTIADGRKVDAKVSFVSDVADMQTRAFRIELVADNAAQLSDGLNAHAEIRAGTNYAVHIPRNALVYSDDGTLGVRLITDMTDDAHGTVAFQPVELVGEDDEGAYVSGIENDATLIIRGQDYVRAGSVVAFTDREAESGS